jgi:hypothetical protein
MVGKQSTVPTHHLSGRLHLQRPHCTGRFWQTVKPQCPLKGPLSGGGQPLQRVGWASPSPAAPCRGFGDRGGRSNKQGTLAIHRCCIENTAHSQELRPMFT